MEDDNVLVERYRAGDSNALEELVKRYQKQIYAFLYRMTNNSEDAKDLTQRIFLKAFNGIKGFRKESSFKTWLYRIAINTSATERRENKYAEVEIEDTMQENQVDALSELVVKEKRESIQEALREIPERQRMAIILRVYDGLSCKDTAQVMECSEGAVKAHYHNGVKSVREILKGKGYEIRS